MSNKSTLQHIAFQLYYAPGNYNFVSDTRFDDDDVADEDGSLVTYSSNVFASPFDDLLARCIESNVLNQR